MSIICIYLIKILFNCFQPFQILLKLIFYLFIYKAIECAMSVCGDNYQRPIWSNIGILCGLFDVFDTNIINTFVQITFGTIEMYFRSFWSWIYSSYNNNNYNNSSTNTQTKLFVNMSVLLSRLIDISIVCSNSATCAPYSKVRVIQLTHILQEFLPNILITLQL